MIWIVGEYAERIDNADELLESFLEGFHDESTQVSSHLYMLCHRSFGEDFRENKGFCQEVWWGKNLYAFGVMFIFLPKE